MPASAHVAFWTPLLDSNINQESRRRYEKAALAFMAFVREHGDWVEDAGDLDHWFAYYAHTAYMAGRPLSADVMLPTASSMAEVIAAKQRREPSGPPASKGKRER